MSEREFPKEGAYPSIKELIYAMRLRAPTLRELNHDGTAEMLEEAIRFLSDTQSRWIPVSERLPETADIVATLYADGERGLDSYEDGCWDAYEAAREEYEAVRCAEMVFGFTKPTHWMPLPETPKEGTK